MTLIPLISIPYDVLKINFSKDLLERMTGYREMDG